jgi:hypothetical protein
MPEAVSTSSTEIPLLALAVEILPASFMFISIFRRELNESQAVKEKHSNRIEKAIFAIENFIDDCLI